MSSEMGRIARLRAIFATESERVTLGIGDDAAVLAPCGEALVWTVDAAVEGVHFRRDLASLEDVGFRATMAAASDLAAMGAEPVALLAALVLPESVSDEDLEAIARGQRAAGDLIGAPIAGGNLARGGELSITTTAIGAARRPLRRDGARDGDALWLAGPVGLAAAGLALLMRGGQVDADQAVSAWRRPVARIQEGLRASLIATSAIDVSDGLAQDLGHVARASGVRAVIEAGAIVSPELRAAAARVGADPLELALHGGEDYALVVSAPVDAALDGFVRIGRCEAGGAGSAVVLIDAHGVARAVDERGFDHFRASS